MNDTSFSRRSFLKATAAAVLAVSVSGVLAGCDDTPEIASATIGLGEFEVTVTGDMTLTGDEVVGNENANGYLCKPNVKIKYNGSGFNGDIFSSVFKAKIDKTELKLQNKTDTIISTAGPLSKTYVPQFKASTSEYGLFKSGTPFKLYVTLQKSTAEFSLTADGKVTVAPVQEKQ